MKQYFVAESYNLDNKKYEISVIFQLKNKSTDVVDIFVNLNQLCFKYRAMENFTLKTGIAMQSMLTCGKITII